MTKKDLRKLEGTIRSTEGTVSIASIDYPDDLDYRVSIEVFSTKGAVLFERKVNKTDWDAYDFAEVEDLESRDEVVGALIVLLRNEEQLIWS
jgi:hypothetical protein